MIDLSMPPAWTSQAVCASVDPEAFFPEKGGDRGRAAIKVCQSCPVQAECLDYALDMGEDYGIWGGLTHRHLRARRRNAA